MNPPAPPGPLDRLVATAVAHHHIERWWGRQHLVTAGPPGAPPVLLVHGWPQHWLAWRHVIAALAPTNRVVAVDLRGFGWSTCDSPAGTTVADLADDLVVVLDHLAALDHVHHETAALVTHDWGGWIGFRAAQDAPRRFRRHCALGIVPPWLDPGAMLRRLPDWAYVVPMAVAGDRIALDAATVRWLIDHSTHDPLWHRPGDAEALGSYLDRVAQPGSAAMTRHLYATLLRRELPAAWATRRGTVEVPTTVVVGEHETIARPELFWDRTEPGALRVATIPGARHWLAEERPDALVAVLRAQLS